MRRPVNSFTRISSVHGQITNMGKFGRHLGVDYAGGERTLYSPVSGTIVFSGSSATLGNYYEISENGNGRLHRLAHLKSRTFGKGAKVIEGQVIGVTGNTGISTGPHLHWDIRKGNTVWDASFANYYNPEALLATAASSSFRVKPGYKFRVYKPGTTQVLGTIDYNWGWYINRGTDPKYPNRWLANSATFGQFAFPWADIKMNPYRGEYDVK